MRSAAVLNWGALVLAAYAAYYMALEPLAGGSWGLLLGMPMWLSATAFEQHVPHAWAWALGLHILSWFLQVCAPACLSACQDCRKSMCSCLLLVGHAALLLTAWSDLLAQPQRCSSEVSSDKVDAAVMQIEVGHIMIEHKKPALLDSFFQVFVCTFLLPPCRLHIIACRTDLHTCL